MNLPFIDQIWRVRGSLALEASQTPADTFDKLDPLFQTNGTNYRVDGDTLTFSKTNPAAQDKMSMFSRGTIRVVNGGARPQLVYDLVSPALLACFLAPLLFLSFAQIAIFVNEMDRPAEAAAEEKPDEPEETPKLNPIDAFLGAPEPDDPKKKEAEKAKAKAEGKDQKHSPTPAYVFAGLFAALYVFGRILEARLIRSRFRKLLAGEPLTRRGTTLAH